MVAFGTTKSWTALLTLPAGLLTGFAFAAPVAAYAATQERDSGFNAIYRFGVVPLFLFSGTFFPVSQLPAAIQPIAYLTPLWHGVNLCRTLALGTAEPLLTAVNVVYLTAIAAAGVFFATRTYRARLET
jgi:lipooligosaccharide transport system permease protein